MTLTHRLILVAVLVVIAFGYGCLFAYGMRDRTRR